MEKEEERAQSMFLPRVAEPVRSYSDSADVGAGRASFSQVPMDGRGARDVQEEMGYDPARHGRRRTTSALGALGTNNNARGQANSGYSHHDYSRPEGAMTKVSPRSSSTTNNNNNRKTSVVQRSESSFSVHSEGGVETYCESPSYFPSNRRSQDHDREEEDAAEDKARFEEEEESVEEERTPVRKSRPNPRISIALPGSSFNLGLDFGLTSSDTIQGTSLASLIEGDEAAAVVQERFGGSGSNPTTPVMSQGWDDGEVKAKPVARSSTRKSQSKRALRSPSITLSPAETVK
jgi:hypothetical protein